MDTPRSSPASSTLCSSLSTCLGVMYFATEPPSTAASRPSATSGGSACLFSTSSSASALVVRAFAPVRLPRGLLCWVLAGALEVGRVLRGCLGLEGRCCGCEGAWVLEENEASPGDAGDSASVLTSAGLCCCKVDAAAAAGLVEALFAWVTGLLLTAALRLGRDAADAVVAEGGGAAAGGGDTSAPEGAGGGVNASSATEEHN
mmetsp:Transcript_24832/g.67646  ORF Transcript_24832/g.67646 Transcript_24832/m.67646 type:complete len:203 (-) Transcript_24832:281-889(-)